MDVYLDEEETYQPDIIFIIKNRISIIEEKSIKGAPDLVVEILSPSTAKDDLKAKFRNYEKHGVQEYWIIDPERKSVNVYLRSKGNLTLHQTVHVNGLVESKVLSGFKVDTGYLFSRPRPAMP